MFRNLDVNCKQPAKPREAFDWEDNYEINASADFQLMKGNIYQLKMLLPVNMLCKA